MNWIWLTRTCDWLSFGASSRLHCPALCLKVKVVRTIFFDPDCDTGDSSVDWPELSSYLTLPRASAEMTPTPPLIAVAAVAAYGDCCLETTCVFARMFSRSSMLELCSCESCDAPEFALDLSARLSPERNPSSFRKSPDLKIGLRGIDRHSPHRQSFYLTWRIGSCYA